MSTVATPQNTYPVPTDFQGYGSPVTPQPAFNMPNQPANIGQAIATTKNPNGSTATVHGTLPNSTITINNPA